MSSSHRLVARCKPCNEGDQAWHSAAEGQDSLQQLLAQADVIKLDRLLEWSATHEELFEKAVSDWVGDVLKGHNLTVLVYGLPSSGKSFTVFGSPGESRTNPSARGIIVRCLEEFTSRLQDKDGAIEVKGSFYHIASDGQVADLIDAKKRNLPVKKLQNGIYSVPQATQQTLTSVQDVVKLVEKAVLMRNATGSIRRENKFSVIPSGNPLREYRPHNTHAVFQYTVECCNKVSSRENVTVSSLTIIDLAGYHIQTFHEDTSNCEDTGITALHTTLSAFGSDSIQVALESCISSTLTQLLCSSFFGNSRCILINTLLMDAPNELLVKKMLKLCQNLQYCKTSSHPVPIPFTKTFLGLRMIQIDELKDAILQELCSSGHPSSTVEIISKVAVRINGRVFDQLPSSCLEKILTIHDIETQSLASGKPVNIQ